MPDVYNYYGINFKSTGGWKGALLEFLKDEPNLKLEVAACQPARVAKYL